MSSMEIILLVMAFLLGGLWDMETEAVSVTGELGKDIEIKCSDTNALKNTKYFCKEACKGNEDILINSTNNDSNKKYSIRDEGNTFYVTIFDLTKDDSGTYRCGIDRLVLDTYNKIILTVKEGKTKEPDNDTTHSNSSKKLVYIRAGLGAVVLAVAIVLLIFFRHRNRDISTSAGIKTDSYTDLSASSPPPPDLCSHFTAKHRESTVTLGLGEYVNVDLSGDICQYQHLDLSRLEEHVYHSLHGNNRPKDGPLAVKEQIN